MEERLFANTLKAQGIRKTFPGVVALDHVDFDVRGGEVHAIVGANGAGKSTLAKILAGAYRPTAGNILLNEVEINIAGPADAQRHGIACAYQEVDTALVSYLSVTENALINRISRAKSPIFMNWPKLHREAEALLDRVDLRVNVRQPISELTLHEKQKIVIAQALEAQAKFLILDEPTAPLSLREVEQLFTLIHNLTEEGLGIIYISHRMSEVFEIAARITIMRDGQKVGTVTPQTSSSDDVIFMMLDKTLEQEYEREGGVEEFGPVTLEVKDLYRPPLVNDISFQVRAGEVLGITGLVGAGKTELARVLFGADRPVFGEVRLLEKRVRFRSPADAVKAGVMLVPEERRQQGVLVDMSIAQNLSLPSLQLMSKVGFVQRGREQQTAETMIKELGVVCRDTRQEVRLLSGGNQQKISVGKWLIASGHLFIFDEPTKGVDVGAKTEIFRLVGQLAQAGKSIIYLSSEIPEILGICDRILVMYDGRIVAEFEPDQASQDLILKYATGGGD